MFSFPYFRQIVKIQHQIPSCIYFRLMPLSDRHDQRFHARDRHGSAVCHEGNPCGAYSYWEWNLDWLHGQFFFMP